ncbi:MAG TPA: T9SS type A sorting domain-containing protein, partial [Candidatus Kapabacteria bacterium]
IDTAVIVWQTDITPPYSSENKDRSIVIAQGQGTTGVEMPSLASFGVSIYPQPARDNYTVEVSLQEAEPITITVYDILGKSVLHRAATGTSGMNRYLFQAKELPSGTYTVITRIAGESVIKRVVLE